MAAKNGGRTGSKSDGADNATGTPDTPGAGSSTADDGASANSRADGSDDGTARDGNNGTSLGGGVAQVGDTLPLGLDFGAQAGESGADTGAGRGSGSGEHGRRRGRPPGSRTRNRNTRTRQAARPASETVPGSVDAPPRRTRVHADNDAAKVTIATTTRELIEDVWTAAYWIPAQITGVRAVELSPTEAKVLAERSEALIKSLGTKRAKQTLGILDKYAPGVSLAVAAAIITMPKIRAVQMARATAIQQGAGSAANGFARAQGQPGAAARGSNGNPVAPGDVGSVADVGNGQQPDTGGSLRPFTSADLAELSGSDASPHV